MKRFHWRLQRVLDLRQKQEQALQAELANINHRLKETQDELIRQETSLNDLLDGLNREDPAARCARQAFVMTYTAANDKAVKNLKLEIQSLQRQRSEKTDEIVKLKQFNEGLLKLRDRAQQAFIEREEKHEQKEQDDAAAFRMAYQQ